MNGERSDPNEVGRALAPRELIERTVVCVAREDRPSFMTLWVEQVTKDHIVFQAGAARPVIHFIVMRRPDDTLVDDEGKRILVHEYLGEV
ncbi:MAG TPA: hypothetical protein VGP83_17205 [Pyrinomonadaceae bacterium]|jgi:hypothetical protein|nr:hypothetical protein [Pyrinomonadaceae bacterium]